MTNKPTELVVTQALLPCPFCGKRAIIETFPSGLKQVSCSDDDASSCLAAITWGSFATEAEAIAAWNTRLAFTAPASEDEVVEKVRAPLIRTLQRGGHTLASQANAREALEALAALRPRSEREEIVAWLREQETERLEQIGHGLSGGGPQYDLGRATAYAHAADAIERGDFKESGE